MKKLFMVATRVSRPNRLLGSIFISLAVITLAFSAWLANTHTLGAEDKCTICHVPPGNPPNAHTLVIGCSAVDAHMRNHPGDCLGPCPCQPTPSQNQ